MISKLPPWLDRNREWVGMDVDIGDGDSLLDSEGEGDIGEQEDGKLRSMNPDLEEDTGIEKPSEAEDSDTRNPSEKNDKDTGEKQNVGENLIDPDPSHVIVDEEVDFDQFGAPPPDLPVVDDSERKQDKGIGSPVGESRAADVEELKDVADTDLKDLNDESSLMDTEGKEQRDPEPDVDPEPAALADDEERDSNTEPTAEERAASDPELREFIQAGPGKSLLEQVYRRAKELDQVTLEQEKRIGDLRAQVDYSNTQLEEKFRICEELTRKLKAEHEERLRSEEKLMELQELLPNMEEKLKNSTDQVELLEVQLQEQAEVRKELENDVQDKTQLHMQLKQLSEQVHLQEVQLQEQAKVRKELENDVQDKTQLHTQLKQLSEQLHLQEVQLQEQAKVRKELENDVQEKTQLHTQLKQLSEQLHLQEVQLQEQAKVRKELENDVQEKTQLHTQLEQLSEQLHLQEVQLQEQAKVRKELENDVQEKTQLHTQLKQLSEQLHLQEVQLQEQAKVRKELENDVQEKTQLHTQLEQLSEQLHLQDVQLQEQASSRRKLEDDWKEKTKQLEERTKSHEEIARRLDEEQDARFASEADVMILREMFTNAEEKLKDLHDHVDSLTAQIQEETESRSAVEEKMKDLRDQVDSLEEQLQKETELRSSFEEKLKWKERQHTLALEEHSRILEELLQRIEELKSETHLKEEKAKDLHNQVESLAAQLQEQEELKKEVEGKGDNERALLPVSSMPWSEEKLEFEKLLDAQKSLFANQVHEAEKLRTEAEKKVGLLNHQVQNLEVLTDIAETLEHVFSAKDRVVRQALWTAFQALCVGVALISFIAACRDPSRSCLIPT